MTAKAEVARKTRAPWDVWKLRPLPGGWITLEDAAGEMGTSRQAVHNLVKRGTLEARRSGRKPVILVREADVKALPVSPQRRRELRLRGELPADLGDELPEG